MVVRAGDLKKAMSQYLIDQITATSNVKVLKGCEVIQAGGEGHLEELTLRQCDTGETQRIPTTAMFIFIGSAPRSEFVADLVARDSKGFIVTGPDLPTAGPGVAAWPLHRAPYFFETSVPGIFAAGDVRASANRRVATAVGEGAAAVHAIHRYLESV
jgi:thioredoxin reductase (NADPH)